MHLAQASCWKVAVGAMCLGIMIGKGFCDETNISNTRYCELRLSDTTNVMRVDFSARNSGSGARATWFRDRVLPYIIRQAFVTNQTSELILNLHWGDRPDETYFSKGVCETVYALGQLLPETSRQQWQQRVLPERSNRIPVTAVHTNVLSGVRELSNASAVDKEQICALATTIFNENRPELIATCPAGMIFFEPKTDQDWRIYADGNSWIAFTKYADRMFAANFCLRFQKGNDGNWNCSGIFGQTRFKGE